MVNGPTSHSQLRIDSTAVSASEGALEYDSASMSAASLASAKHQALTLEVCARHGGALRLRLRRCGRRLDPPTLEVAPVWWRAAASAAALLPLDPWRLRPWTPRLRLRPTRRRAVAAAAVRLLDWTPRLRLRPAGAAFHPGGCAPGPPLRLRPDRRRAAAPAAVLLLDWTPRRLRPFWPSPGCARTGGVLRLRLRRCCWTGPLGPRTGGVLRLRLRRCCRTGTGTCRVRCGGVLRLRLRRCCCA